MLNIIKRRFKNECVDVMMCQNKICNIFLSNETIGKKSNIAMVRYWLSVTGYEL